MPTRENDVDKNKSTITLGLMVPCGDAARYLSALVTRCRGAVRAANESLFASMFYRDSHNLNIDSPASLFPRIASILCILSLSAAHPY